jgi:tetratricopeptide (TPR) repeat protein
MRRRLPTFALLSVLAAPLLVQTGCAPGSVMPYTAEVDDPDYRRGKELLRMGREQEALSTFLRLIDQRGGAAADSHLEVAILYHKHIKDPIAAIYHYRRYRELRPNTEQSRLVLQSIEACIRDFTRTLPARPLDNLDNADQRTSMLDAVDRLQRENLQLKEQLAAARAAVLDASRLASANGGNDLGVGADENNGFAVTSPGLEPSQGGGFITDAQGNALAPRGGQSQLPEYSTPVGVVPVTPVNPPSAPPPAQPVNPPPAQGLRKHVVARGDTLMSISLRYYGNRSRWRDIFAANRDQLPTESSLQIGMELRLPQ